AGGYAAWMARPPPPTPEPIVLLPPPLPAAEVVTQVPEPARVTITIRSTPAGAWLSRADSGKGLGTTPFQGTFEKSPEGVTVRFEREGFQPEVRRISLDEDLDLHVDLQLPPSRRANKVAAKKREARSRDDVLNPFDD
ncbi:MAG TPA: PEGA domain-containing protein, partial [Myxococcaceae bacterium]|nr:PEGA domain-containing protein [Myxococcaceae bacterium]